ncbi:MAG: DUF4276 family protein [Gammaproteobacteria bacterium]|nr:DUF4276 family protein [Gammaproteobacteria bacterium]
MTRIVFFLEERSAKEMLNGLLPRLLPDALSFHCFFFEGKQSLRKQLPIKLRGWRAPDTCFVVLQDQDRGACEEEKNKLAEICREAGRPEVLVRIVCRELESWYLADLNAVGRGLGIRNLARHQEKAVCRNPDGQQSPTAILKRLTRDKYQKVSGSRAIGPHLDLGNTRSASFRNFITGVRRTAGLS